MCGLAPHLTLRRKTFLAAGLVLWVACIAVILATAWPFGAQVLLTLRRNGNMTASPPSSPGNNHGVRQARTNCGERAEFSVARELSELARELEAEPDFTAVMQRIVMAAVAELSGATAAAITLVQHGQVSSPAHSSDRAERAGAVQSETGEGLCVNSDDEGLTIRVDDLREFSRWPTFAARAVEMGFLSLLSFQLLVGHDSIGALNIYSDRAGGFDSQDEETGLLLASQAAIAIRASREVTGLRIAMDTRDVIGQAKGILMERYKIDRRRAFDLLVRTSGDTNRKLRDIAEHLATTGELPGLVRPTQRDYPVRGEPARWARGRGAGTA